VNNLAAWKCQAQLICVTVAADWTRAGKVLATLAEQMDGDAAAGEAEE
jgi:hypothetical protein